MKGGDFLESRFFKAAFSAFLTLLVYYMNIIAVPVMILVFVMSADYVTGLISAWINAELSSEKGIFGIVKKICYLFAVAAAMGTDWLIYSGMGQIGINLDYTIFFGVLVTIWLIINEIISILENLAKIGVPLPKFLISVINRLKYTTENKFESEEK